MYYINILRARNNMMLDIMWACLTNPTTADQVLTPGGFNEQKKAAYISIILENTTKSELKGKHLMDMSLDQLEELANKYEKDLDTAIIENAARRGENLDVS